MSKFSKGPWTPTAGQIPPESIWSHDGQTRVCRLSDRYDDGPKDHATIQANADLIAAAPDLLEALEAMWIEHTRPEPIHYARSHDERIKAQLRAYDLAYAAIKKARGE